MNVYYYANKQFPNTAANSVQIIKTVGALKKKGCNIVLVGLKSSMYTDDNKLFDRYGVNKFKIILLNRTSSYLINEFILFFHMIFNFKKIDVIHTRSLILGILAKILLRRNVIYEVHDFVKGKFYKTIFSYGVKRFDYIIVISNCLKKELQKLYGNSNISNFPDGVSVEDFKIQESKKQLREKHVLGKDSFIVTYIGSFQSCKGYDTFLDSVRYVNDSKIKYILIGGNEDHVEKLKSNYSKYKDNLILLPSIPHKEVSSYLKLSDILIIPNSGNESLSENHKVAKYYTSPLKLFEYMCSKKPIIASDVPAIREILDDKSCFFVKPDSSMEIAVAIKKLMKNKILMERLSENSYKGINQYSWSNRAKGLIDVYNDVLRK